MRAYQVIDTHTVGHPTRAIMGGLPPLTGDTVLARRDDFKARHDNLRGQLIHEPRGHAAMVAAVMTDSRAADFGAFFISSYVYLDMCGHATIGLARTLAATGQVDIDSGPAHFTLETPAGIVGVDVSKADDGAVTASIANVPAYVEIDRVTVEVDGIGKVDATVACCGGRFALVDTDGRNWPIEPDNASELCRLGNVIKASLNGVVDEPVGSVLFFRDDDQRRARHLVVLESNKFDRSPCGTGTSARLAALHAAGKIDVGEQFIAESVLGAHYRCRIDDVLQENGRVAVRPRVAGEAYLSAFSTLMVEDCDPLADGFLFR